MQSKRLVVTISGASEEGPGEAVVADATFANDEVIVRTVDGAELARANVTPGDDPWVIARRLLPRRRANSFWGPLPSGRSPSV